MKLYLNRRGGVARLAPRTEALLRRAVKLSLLRVQADPGWEVGLTLTDDREIQKLNRDYRGLDRATDVLSFSAGDEGPQPDRFRKYLGDIVISAQRAAEQAEAYGHSEEREIAFLTIHGTLHLLGLDHETEEERSRMEKLQRQILRDLGLREL